MHRHRREDEIGYVLKGALEIRLGDGSRILETAGSPHCPRVPPRRSVTIDHSVALPVSAVPAGIDPGFRFGPRDRSGHWTARGSTRSRTSRIDSAGVAARWRLGSRSMQFPRVAAGARFLCMAGRSSASERLPDGDQGRRALVLFARRAMVDLIELTLESRPVRGPGGCQPGRRRGPPRGLAADLALVDMAPRRAPRCFAAFGTSRKLAASVTPVLGLTRRGDLAIKLRLFDLGVDDIVAIPSCRKNCSRGRSSSASRVRY